VRGLRWVTDGPAWLLYVHAQWTAIARIEVRGGRYHWYLTDGPTRGVAADLDTAQAAAQDAALEVWG